MNNHLQRPTLNAHFDRRLADVFAVGVNIQRDVGFHPQACGLEILYAANVQVASEVDSWKHAGESEGIDAANHADVELSVIHFRAGRDLHPAAVGGSVGEGSEDGWLIAARCPTLAFVGGQNFYRKRRKPKNRGHQSERITAMTAQPARQFVGAAGYFAV